jgi:hypothetical protein
MNYQRYFHTLPESIKHNFEESKKYLVADNIIYNKLKEYESN